MDKKKPEIRENVPHWFCQNHDLLDKLLGGEMLVEYTSNSNSILHKRWEHLYSQKPMSRITTEQMLLDSS